MYYIFPLFCRLSLSFNIFFSSFVTSLDKKIQWLLQREQRGRRRKDYILHDYTYYNICILYLYILIFLCVMFFLRFSFFLAFFFAPLTLILCELDFFGRIITKVSECICPKTGSIMSSSSSSMSFTFSQKKNKYFFACVKQMFSALVRFSSSFYIYCFAIFDFVLRLLLISASLFMLWNMQR